MQFIDGRDLPSFNGNSTQNIAGCRQGRIKTAVRFGPDNYHQGDFKTLKSPAEWETLFESLGLDKTKPTITYCRTGVSATAVYLAL